MKLGVIGALGRMGREVIKAALVEREKFTRIIGLTKPHTDPHLFDFQQPEVVYCADRARLLAECDVIIDFSRPEVFDDLALSLQDHPVPYVIGTTGLTPQHHKKIDELAARVPILQSYNMSFGINVLKAVLAQVAQNIGAGFDIALMDRHHRHKKDAPSGTAKMLQNTLEENLTAPTQIQVNCERIGHIFGEHRVTFACDNELIELSHVALNRHVFAHGALRAANWLVKQRKPGRYAMEHVFTDGLEPSQ